MQRKVNVVEDLDGNKIVVIHDIRFKGRQSIEWTDVEKYLKQYVGEAHIIESTNDMVYIGVDLPEEYIMESEEKQIRRGNQTNQNKRKRRNEICLLFYLLSLSGYHLLRKKLVINNTETNVGEEEIKHIGLKMV